MSSACVCHTDEWCFYCNMYTPLEKKAAYMEGLLRDSLYLMWRYHLNTLAGCEGLPEHYDDLKEFLGVSNVAKMEV